jgi:immunity protein Imm1 of predicted polymorphic toxin system
MYVKRLTIEDQRILDPYSPELAVSDPSWDQVETAIQQMDGRFRTLVILGQENSEFDYMVIGGGKEGIYWCGIFDQQGREFTLTDPGRSSTTCVKVPAGQSTSVPLRETVGLHEVIVAAKQYAETGDRTGKLTWVERN